MELRQGDGGGRDRRDPEPAASTGLIPLTQLRHDQKYKEQDGGLYGGGRNEPSDALRRRAEAEAAKVTPLDGEGGPSPDGKVVLLSIGMSNTTQEFSRFMQVADLDPLKSPRLVIVDGAQGGRDAADWSGGPGSARVWATVEQRLAAAGVTPRQVQVVWLKQARRDPGSLGEFPQHARELQGHLVKILEIAKSRYPNLRLAYLSSRIYGGYAKSRLNPEPYAYESAFAVRWVIADQLQRLAARGADGAEDAGGSPLVLWGPYLWADGINAREGDSLSWVREDFAGDGTHPSASGRQKVAELLLRFFKTEPTTRIWFAEAKAP